MMRPMQCRMARAALDWSLRDLEEVSGVNRTTISRYEAGKEILTGSLEQIEKVLREEGIQFIEADHVLGPGIRVSLDLWEASASETGSSAQKRQALKERSQKWPRK